MVSAQDESAGTVFSEGMDPNRGSEWMNLCIPDGLTLPSSNCRGQSRLSHSQSQPALWVWRAWPWALKSMDLWGRQADLPPGREVLIGTVGAKVVSLTCLQAQQNIKEKLHVYTNQLHCNLHQPQTHQPCGGSGTWVKREVGVS